MEVSIHQENESQKTPYSTNITTSDNYTCEDVEEDMPSSQMMLAVCGPTFSISRRATKKCSDRQEL